MEPVPETGCEKKESINLIKRITNNFKSSKNPPEDNSGGSSGVPQRSVQGGAQPRLLQAVHGRSGSCPSQLLDLSALKITPINQQRPAPLSAGDQQAAKSFGSQRVRGQKERPALHNLHRHLGERKEDLTVLGSMHKKSNSLDAGRLISGPSTSATMPSGASVDQNGNSARNGSSRGTTRDHHAKEK